MSFYKLYDFLRDLQKNNAKEWMDEHRSEYHEVRDFYIDWLNKMDMRLAEVDTDYHPTTGKKAINRINNNLLYHPNKPIYKDHFGAGLDGAPNHGDFYIHLGTSESFIAGGFYKPKNDLLHSIRQAVDYNGEEFIKILNKKSFKAKFGNLIDDGDSLKTAPKGFSQDHKYIELLRMKSFAVQYDLTQKIVTSDDFEELVVDVYKEMLPFRNYLNQAVSV
ncbi:MULTISPECIES: DUF2461 domain-containing protein [unclassified Leeuwenhoekiella]|uniref:DUF2461 domain-containing protein n=1 Tax=unclassified Leeuwenhoekiella TaxID=2615029 RepID=UPI000C517CEE|nr:MULTISPECIES: DUF2461 domain-containing protein [unclassified Leeuwenhoekiella]MBA82571.1 TIGR02453 family protein [Leeuwenhoekiella sp.]|tara:strand:+ start:52338 stop:52994 length:657 start_codon:yes stop_codon:yes gene_type:complete